MSSSQTTTTEKADLDAVVEALRSHDRFLVTTHENPDGDALGSLLAATLALRQLGKDVYMYLAGHAPLPRRVHVHAARRARSATLPDDGDERVLLAVDCANESRLGPDPEILHQSPFTIDIDHHHDNTRFGDVNLIVADASSTAEVLRDVFRELGVELTPEIAEALYIALVTDTGRFQYANTTPKALRLAAELVEAGADVHRVFQGVYENVQFAKLKLLARALERAQVYEGGALVVSFLLRNDFAEVGAAEPYSEGIIDYLRAVEGAIVSVLIREPPRVGRADAARVAAVEHRRDRRLRDRAQVERRRPPAGGRASRARRRSTRSRTSSAASTSRRLVPRALEPAGVVLVDKPAGPSSFKVIAGAAAADRARARVTPARSIRSPPGCCSCCPDGRLSSSRASSAWTSATSRTSTSRRRRRPAIRRARSSSSTSRRTADELEERLAALRGEVELPIPAASAVKIGGERAYRLARRGVEVAMPMRRSQVYALDVVAYTDGVATLDLRVSSGTYVRAIAAALGGHCRTLRRLEIGPFSVDEADPERMLPPARRSTACRTRRAPGLRRTRSSGWARA